MEDGDQHLLTRPRRFGKTLLLDTIRCIFMENGRKKDTMFDLLLDTICGILMRRGSKKDDLFKGLDITKTDEGKNLLKQQRPVVFLRMNKCVATEGKENLMNEINERIIEEAKRNGVNDVQPAERACGTTLSRAINAIRRKHNSKRVVLLVDEFDGPLTAVLEGNGGETDERVRENLSVLRGLYNGCKALAAEGQFYYSMYAGLTRPYHLRCDSFVLWL